MEKLEKALNDLKSENENLKSATKKLEEAFEVWENLIKRITK